MIFVEVGITEANVLRDIKEYCARSARLNRDTGDKVDSHAENARSYGYR